MPKTQKSFGLSPKQPSEGRSSECAYCWNGYNLGKRRGDFVSLREWDAGEILCFEFGMVSCHHHAYFLNINRIFWANVDWQAFSKVLSYFEKNQWFEVVSQIVWTPILPSKPAYLFFILVLLSKLHFLEIGTNPQSLKTFTLRQPRKSWWPDSLT